jgi:hypothetical protein
MWRAKTLMRRAASYGVLAMAIAPELFPEVENERAPGPVPSRAQG